ncbi:hypothetical protein OH77DRAFT_1149394 [Trametes cingulata]|nr:hypothetical protein OH77DRAFT_1149394 [Trametes cingulata]
MYCEGAQRRMSDRPAPICAHIVDDHEPLLAPDRVVRHMAGSRDPGLRPPRKSV